MDDDDDDKPVRKRTKKPPPHECTVILIDVGSNMKEKIDGVEAMQQAKDAVEWILTRKIFADSNDEFLIGCFGSEETQNSVTDDENVYFWEEEMQKARMDWIRRLEKEIKPSEYVVGDFLAATIAGLEQMRVHLTNNQEGNITGRNILLITNLHKAEEFLDEERAEAIVNGMKALDISFSVIGPTIADIDNDDDNDDNDDDEENSQGPGDKKKKFKSEVKMEAAERLLKGIAKKVDGVVYSFAEALPVLQRFVPRKVNIRGQKFYFEIAQDLKLPLQMYKKIQPADFKLTMGKYAMTSDAEVKRKTVYERKKDDDDVADTDDADRSGLPVLEKEDIVKGYKFGTTIIPLNAEDLAEYGWKRESRCMKLIQFAKRSQILEHYLMDGGTSYFVPLANDQDGCVAISALVNAMIAEDTVALTRFVYSSASTPRIMALFPKISKKGVDMFMGIQLPFYEDFRGLDFPALDDPENAPRQDFITAVDALVTAMDLSKSRYDPETGKFVEDLRPRDVPNPKLQYVCHALKHRALHPHAALPPFDSKMLGELEGPKESLLKLAKDPLNFLKEKFPLLESPSKKKRQKKDIKEEDELPGFGVDNSTLPASGFFRMADEV